MNMEIMLELFCNVDDFINAIFDEFSKSVLPEELRKRRTPNISESEIMSIVIFFQTSGFRTFKQYYLALEASYKAYFPRMPSYSRFVRLMPNIIVQLYMYAQTLTGVNTGIAFIDSTVLRVCNIKRSNKNRVFKGIAKKGKSTVGWFYGFKLHLVINEVGELLGFHVTPGNVDDRAPVDKITKGLYGKLFADKGYISKALFEKLYERGLQLVTGIKSNMKNKLMPMMDKILLRKRSIIETVNDQFKNVCQVEHSRHRSPTNFLINVFAAVVAYEQLPKKPSINMDFTFEDLKCLGIEKQLLF